MEIFFINFYKYVIFFSSEKFYICSDNRIMFKKIKKKLSDSLGKSDSR